MTEKQDAMTKEQAIAEALEICRDFRQIVNLENSWEEIGMSASDRMQEILWVLEAAEVEWANRTGAE